MIPTLERVQAKDAELRRVVDKVATFGAALQSIPILDGRLVRDVELSGVLTKVAHGLARRPLGWIIVSRINATGIWDSAPKDGTFLYLGANDPVTVDLWVF